MFVVLIRASFPNAGYMCKALMNKNYLIKRVLIPFFCLIYAGAAIADEVAQPAGQPSIAVASSVTLVSDYLFRGISQTWGRPALQFAIEASHASGLYGGLFGSNVSDEMYPDAQVELDLYGGKRGKLPGVFSALNYDLGLIYVYYPGADYDQAKFANRYDSSKFNTAELYASLNYKWLTVKTGRTLTEFFGWNINNSGVGGGFYGDASAGVTGSTRGSWYTEVAINGDLANNWSLNALAGHQSIANSRHLDWNYYKVGIAHSFANNWVANLSYSDTSDTKAYRNFWGLQNSGETYDVAKGRILFSVTYNF